MLVIILLFMLIFIILPASLVDVPKDYEYVIYRNGQYHQTWKAGKHYRVPFIDVIRQQVFTGYQSLRVSEYPCITRDNQSVVIPSVIKYYVFDSAAYAKDPSINLTIDNVFTKTMRSVIGERTLSEINNNFDDIAESVIRVMGPIAEKNGICINSIDYIFERTS